MNKIIKAVDHFNMLKNTKSIVVGVSGGADSMMLLSVLKKLTQGKNINIIAAHVNHMIRGEEAQRDENFVSEFCKNQKIQLEILSIDVKKEALKLNIGLEECGRNIRYKFFKELSDKYNSKIATAHTLSDNIETIFLNITRGCGLNGLSGIPPVRDNIIRPLIFVTKKEVLNYCNKNNIPYITDSSNFNKKYSRNKIRLDVIPVLKEINPSLESTVLKMITQINNDCDCLNNIAKDKIKKAKTPFGYNIKSLVNLDYSIMTRCIIIIVKENCDITLESMHVKLIAKNMYNGFGAVNIKKNLYVTIKNNLLKIEKNITPKNIKWEHKFSKPEILTETGRTFIIDIIDFNEYNKRIVQNKNLIKWSLDYSCINNNTVIRNRRPADLIKLQNRNVTKSLKKLFNEEKIDISKRNELAVIANDNKILWLEDFGASEFSKVNKNTKKIAMIFVKGCYNA